MHVAAVLSKDPTIVRAYMEAVVEFKDRFPEKEKEIAPCLEFPLQWHVACSITAMIKGTGVVVDACVSTILDSKLSLKYQNFVG